MTDATVVPAVINTGTYAGEALEWVVATFGVPIGGLLTAWLLRLFKNEGIIGAGLLRNKLQSIIVNGLNLAAAQAARDLAGRGTIEIKNSAVATAVRYAQDHGADTLKALGLDPTSPQAVEAIKARIETAITDPSTPTNPALSPPAVAVKSQSGTQ